MHDINKHDIVVIGGGISGLSFAQYSASAGHETLVLEKDQRLGGCLHTHRVADGFWLELGAHSTYNSYAKLIDIIERNKLLRKLRPREKAGYKLYKNQKICSIATQINYFEILTRIPFIPFLKKKSLNFRDYYSGIIGKGNFDNLIGPVVSAVPSQKVDNFPADMLFKKRQRRKDIAKKFTLEYGLMSLPEAISEHSLISTKLGVSVKSLKQLQGEFEITTECGSIIKANQIVLAVPPPQAASLLTDSFPEIATELNKVKTAKIETVGVIAKRSDVPLKKFAGLIPLNDVFYSIVSRDYYSDDTHRGFAFHFKEGLSEAEKSQRISEVLKTPIDKLELTKPVSRVLPSPELGHYELIANIQTLLSGKKLFLTGNYFEGLAIEDCVERSKMEFDRMAANV